MSSSRIEVWRKQNAVADADGNITSYTWGKETVAPVTARALIEGYTNCFLHKYDSTHNWLDSTQEAANVWNGILRSYIKFEDKTFITMGDIREILVQVGINDAAGKNLNELKDYLTHTHDTTKSGAHEACECSHVCSNSKIPFIQAGVKAGTVGTYSHYIEAEVSSTTSDLDGIMSEKIKLRVIPRTISSGTNYYTVAECVCRLGIEPIIVPAELTPNWTSESNYIQPEGITNIGIDIEIDEKCKDISYQVNIKPLIDELFDSQLLMEYGLNHSQVQIDKIGSVANTRIDSKYYKVTPNTNGLAIEFNESTSIDPLRPAFYADRNETYRIRIYIPTKMKSGVKYGATSMDKLNDIKNNYLDQYINTTTGNKTQDITVTLKAIVRLSEEMDIDFGPPIGVVHYDEQYNLSPTSITDSVTLTYLEMAKIN